MNIIFSVVLSACALFSGVVRADQAHLAKWQDKPVHIEEPQPANIWDLPAVDRYVLVAEMEKGVLRVFEKSSGTRLRQVDIFPVTIGKQGYGKTVEGDERTPIGVYRITSRLNDEQLDDFYGREAYPLNYPNVWDRLHKHTGSGIWIHGVESDQVRRPLRDSDGCIVLNNTDLALLSEYLNVGYTKVISVPVMNWASRKSILIQRQDLQRQMDAWERAWESRNPEAYLKFYSTDFTDNEKNYQQWVDYKRSVNTNKRYINVRLSDIGLYQYPEQSNLAMAEFYQDYSSDRFRSKGWKRQLWRLEDDNQWRIIYEKGG